MRTTRHGLCILILRSEVEFMDTPGGQCSQAVSPNGLPHRQS